ncbi:hypothetical protein G9C98_001093 [Cotesia typhae]|uniref:Thioredoxin-like protein 4A n=1 Tax=Cotesia typhae TaxID=2053667 RepID=A0A8J5QWB5_9HYME|nr:hypothetical protein G9C98_001093 [Cotesia typhae]
MSYMLSHLHNGWQVDQAILSEEDRVVVIRFGHDWDPMCMKMDEVLYNIAEKVKKFRRNLFSRHHRSPRLQQNVRIVRPMYSDVLFPQQAHHD